MEVAFKVTRRPKAAPAGFWTKAEGLGYQLLRSGLSAALCADKANEALGPTGHKFFPHDFAAWRARLGIPQAAGDEALRAGWARQYAEAAPGRGASPTPDRVVVGEGGRIVIPAPYREALGVHEGDELRIRFEDGELRLTTTEHALRRAQQALRRHVPAGRSLADEVIAERRREAERE